MNVAYKIEYWTRRLVNFFLLHTLYRWINPEVNQHMMVYAQQSYSRASIKFLKKELSEYILSDGPGFNRNSTVMDVGGETGVWAMQIHDKYAPQLKIYEPNPNAVAVLKERFKDKSAEIFPFGLGARNQTCMLSNDGMGSSVFATSRNYDKVDKIEISIRDVREAFEELNLPEVDLIKINIEGGEYELLPRLIETGLINRCKLVRIQFHDWIPGAFAMRRRIVRQLAKTHNVEWSYPMVWESWIRKDFC
jgi:FkbM family methyltransferase